MGWLENTKVLVADDDKLSVDLAKCYLTDMWISNENIDVANNGNEAVNKTKKNLFDVVIMDIRMPWMTGIQATQEIKDHHNGNSPIVIAYTASASDVNKPEFNIMDGIMVKPIWKEDFQKMLLNALISKALDKKNLG